MTVNVYMSQLDCKLRREVDQYTDDLHVIAFHSNDVRQFERDKFKKAVSPEQLLTSR